MSTINLIEKKIYFNGQVWNPCYDQFISFDTETCHLTLKDAFGEEKTMHFVLDANRLTSHDPELNSVEKIVTYLYSIGMQHNLERVLPELRNKLESVNMEEKFNTLLNTLQDINNDVKEVTIKEVESDDDSDFYDQEGSHTVLNLSGNKYIEDDELDTLCSEVLISSNGQPNFSYINKLKDYGFKVFPTEKDSFGWLGAAVRTNKGLIFFG